MTLAERLRHRLAQLDYSAPLLAADAEDVPADDALVPAAVLVAVTERPEPGVLLTVRTANMRKHAGQIAFPGGRVDPEDSGLIAAALREAQEEIGLAPEHVEVVGTTESYRTITGFLVTPVVAVIPPDLVLRPHAAEVDAIFETPLAHLMNPANHMRREVELQGRGRSYYEIAWQEYRIWGATAAMLVNLYRRLGPTL